MEKKNKIDELWERLKERNKEDIDIMIEDDERGFMISKRLRAFLFKIKVKDLKKFTFNGKD